MRVVLRWLPVGAAALVVLAGYLAWSASHRLDPALIGRWAKTMQSQSGSWMSTFVIDGTGSYRLETVVHDHGRLVASGGQFRMTSSTRTSVSGTYRLLDPAQLEVTSAVGRVTWKRAGGALAYASSQPMAGVWEAWPVIGGVAWHQTITNLPDSTYTLASVVGDSGRITASKGRWHMVSQAGRETDGTYTFTAPGNLVFTAPEGRSLWQRDTARIR